MMIRGWHKNTGSGEIFNARQSVVQKEWDTVEVKRSACEKIILSK
jgi:hypothetical protein